MKCPECGSENTVCIESRAIKEGCRCRRRYACRSCGHRFSTREMYVEEAKALERADKVLQRVMIGEKGGPNA